MKKIILILCCLTLTATVGWAKDYHLVQTYIADDDVATNTAELAVFVLVPPDNSSRDIVFKTFDSKVMEAWLSGLPRDSVVRYDANGFMSPVESAKLEALKTCCQKKGISFIPSNGGD
jgi:hypothetical protein